jgi:hypothetical protein
VVGETYTVEVIYSRNVNWIVLEEIKYKTFMIDCFTLHRSQKIKDLLK